MRKRAGAVALAALLMVATGSARAMADCGAIATALTTVEGYLVTIPPAGPDQDWCVLDGASFRSQKSGWPDLSADRLRLRHTATDIEVDLQGFRAAPRPSDPKVDDRIRSLTRLQTANLRLRLVHDPVTEVLSISGLRLDLSSGAALELDAEIRGADLSRAALARGAVTRATLVWRSDGRLLRPVMDLVGEELSGTGGASAVDASRAALASVVEALPAGALDDPSRAALAAAVRALPQGRGKLTLTVRSDAGIGAGRMAIAALSGDPTSAKALEALFDRATITAAWEPGLAP